MRKNINENIAFVADNSLHDKIISCIYLNTPEIDIIEYTTGKIGKKLSRSLFFEGMVQEQLLDGSILDIEVGCQYVVNLNTMRREVHRVILNMASCRMVLLSHIYRVQKQLQEIGVDIINAIIDTEQKTFSEYYEKNGINGLRDYTLEVGEDYVSTNVKGIGLYIMRMDIAPLALEQRIALRDVLLCKLNQKAFRNNTTKVKYIKSGVTSACIEMNWFK